MGDVYEETDNFDRPDEDAINPFDLKKNAPAKTPAKEKVTPRDTAQRTVKVVPLKKIPILQPIVSARPKQMAHKNPQRQ